MNVSPTRPSRFPFSRVLCWMPLCLAGCKTAASTDDPPLAILHASLQEGPAKIKVGSGETGERVVRAQNVFRAEADVTSEDGFTLTITPNPSEDQAVALTQGAQTPNQNWWNYEPDTESAGLMANEITWVENPVTGVKMRTDGLATKFQVTGFAGTGAVTVVVFKDTTQMFSVTMTATTPSTVSGQGVRMVHYTNNEGHIELRHNNREVEMEVGGFLFP